MIPAIIIFILCILVRLAFKKPKVVMQQLEAVDNIITVVPVFDGQRIVYLDINDFECLNCGHHPPGDANCRCCITGGTGTTEFPIPPSSTEKPVMGPDFQVWEKELDET